jgi:hypothetical protein
LVAHLNGIEGVSGSSPLSSTKFFESCSSQVTHILCVFLDYRKILLPGAEGLPMGLTIIAVILVALVFCFGVLVYGALRWQNKTNDLRTKLEAGRLRIAPATYDPREIEDLPLPVRRYFQAVLKEEQPIIAAARFAHAGEFNMGETQANWRPFTSTQVDITQRPGFDWDGRISIGPGLNVFVHDAYVGGEGLLHAELLGLITLADIRDVPEVAQGELLRYLAEATWYPTALLPSQGVRWEAVDENTAIATLKDGATKVSLEFHFDAEGLITSGRAAARPRTVNGTLVSTPWQGRFWSYEVRNGIRIPLEGEVAWQLLDGLYPYWRGHVTNIAYEFG